MTTVLCSVPELFGSEMQAERVGQRVPDSAFEIIKSIDPSLSDIEARPIVVFAFLGSECPLAALYAPRLNEIAADYSNRDVQFVGVFSNAQDSNNDVAHYSKEFQVAFPVLKDRQNLLADLLGAHRTPEVFVVDEQKTVRFCGRIDDQYAIGFPRSRPDREFLRQAIHQVLEGQTVTQPAVPAVGCLIGRERSEASNSRVTYANSIAAIMNQHCVRCHRDGEPAPFALTDFAEVRGWADMIVEVTSEGRMPPVPDINDPDGHFIVANTVTEEQIIQLKQWVEDGTPIGDPTQVPSAPEFTTGWHLSREPDLVLYSSDEPYEVPAEGLIDYHVSSVDPGFIEDTWVLEAEVVPGNSRVVHHAGVTIRPPDDAGEKLHYLNKVLAGYLPGMQHGPGIRPANWDDLKIAHLVPAGSTLEFQIHYQAIGTPQLDRTRLGLVFCDADEVEHMLLPQWASNHALSIPPNEADYVVSSMSAPITQSLRLFSCSAHMHLRGKSFEFEAIYPDSSRELLLAIPRYDFNWQFRYFLKEPRRLPAGTRILCTARFDNSADNPANPDPLATVGWGPYTTDEMMVGTFDFLLTKDEYMMYIDASQKTPSGKRDEPAEKSAHSKAPARSPNSREHGIVAPILGALATLLIVIVGLKIHWST